MPHSFSIAVGPAEPALATRTADARTADALEVVFRRGSGPGGAYVIAEAGVNHDGVLGNALRLVETAAASGADACKFQIFRADELAGAAAPLARYQRRSPAAGQREMLARLELSDGDWLRIAEHCRRCGVEFLATPFSLGDIPRLQRLDVRAVKIASTDIDNLPLLRAAARLGVPMIVSTGAALETEITRAVGWLRGAGAGDRLALLHCVSRYPTPLMDCNLRAIVALRERFGVPAGFSDHTEELDSGALAVAAGAQIVEKHFTLDRSAAGPDHAISLAPGDLSAYVAAVRRASAALGEFAIGADARQDEVRCIARKSIVAGRALRRGTVLSGEMLAIKRPAGGIPPSEFDLVSGRRLRVDVDADAPLNWSDLE